MFFFVFNNGKLANIKIQHINVYLYIQYTIQYTL